MNRMKQIEERLSAIAVELERPEADLEMLEREIESLKEERAKIAELVEKRAALVASVVEDAPTLRAFSPAGSREPEVYTTASPEYRTAWLKRLMGRNLTEIEERAYAIADSANAVPEATAEVFFSKMVKIAPMLSKITLLRVAGNLKFAAEATNNAATAKHTENTAVTAAADTIVNVTLGGYEFIKVITISASVRAMSVGAFENWLAAMLSRDIARAIDNYIINDATNGLVVATTWTSGTNQIVNTTGLTYPDIADLIALLPAGYDPSASFLMHKKTLWGQVASIVDSAGQPILMRDPAAGMAPTLLGYPVVVDDYVTTANNAIYLGDLEMIVGNLSQDISVEASDQSSFKSASIDYRGLAIFDSDVAQPEAFVRFVTTTA